MAQIWLSLIFGQTLFRLTAALKRVIFAASKELKLQYQSHIYAITKHIFQHINWINQVFNAKVSRRQMICFAFFCIKCGLSVKKSIIKCH